jgi:hypothetical protein
MTLDGLTSELNHLPLLKFWDWSMNLTQLLLRVMAPGEVSGELVQEDVVLLCLIERGKELNPVSIRKTKPPE